jgi:RHS repeat-associated protein
MPFGRTQILVESVENPFRFPGQYYDQETGLNYNYFRYYNPATGRYVTPDPIGLTGGINLWTYTRNNPVNFIDPLGLQDAAASVFYNRCYRMDFSGAAAWEQSKRSQQLQEQPALVRSLQGR